MREQEIALLPLLAGLCPMHSVLNAQGHVVQAGPTFTKLFGAHPPLGMRFLDLIELRRPHQAGDMAALLACAGARLRLRLRAPPHTALKGVLLALPGGGAVVNLSFGISVVEAVRDFGLTGADFAATDLTTEMLYLIEAKSAAMEASRKLNLRLQGARIAAEEQAFTDMLTGLRNRRALDHVLDRLMQSEQDFALLHLDLDFFKQVNDTLGHAAGDHVLQEAVPYRAQDCRISGSIGITLSCAYDSPEPLRMMADADLALYAAKGQGRGCALFHEPADHNVAPVRGIA